MRGILNDYSSNVMKDFRLKYLLCLLTVLACFSSCGLLGSRKGDAENGYSEKRASMEADASQRLVQARSLLSQGRSGEARRVVEKMRKDCYLAITARTASILLMDSIDIAESKQNLARVDSLLRLHADSVSSYDFDEACRKVQFYEQKLRHDKQK